MQIFLLFCFVMDEFLWIHVMYLPIFHRAASLALLHWGNPLIAPAPMKLTLDDADKISMCQNHNKTQHSTNRLHYFWDTL